MRAALQDQGSKGIRSINPPALPFHQIYVMRCDEISVQGGPCNPTYPPTARLLFYIHYFLLFFVFLFHYKRPLTRGVATSDSIGERKGFCPFWEYLRFPNRACCRCKLVLVGCDVRCRRQGRADRLLGIWSVVGLT